MGELHKCLLLLLFTVYFFFLNLSRENGAKPLANSLFGMYKLSNNAEEGRKNYFKLWPDLLSCHNHVEKWNKNLFLFHYFKVAELQLWNNPQQSFNLQTFLKKIYIMYIFMIY